MKTIKLGTPCTDTVTGIIGHATHIQFGVCTGPWYQFVPNGLKPEDQTPHDSYWVESQRLSGNEMIECPEMPFGALGTVAKDRFSGYTGTIIDLTMHINGCIHATLQAPGTDKNTGTKYKAYSTDIRSLSGKMLDELTEKQLEKSKKEKPSPAPSCRPHH